MAMFLAAVKMQNIFHYVVARLKLKCIVLLQKCYNGDERKSAARFWRKVAAWLPDMFCNFYFVKNHKFAKNSTTTNAREKIS